MFSKRFNGALRETFGDGGTINASSCPMREATKLPFSSIKWCLTFKQLFLEQKKTKKSPSVEPESQTGTHFQTQAVIGGKFGRAGDFDGRV